MSTTKHRLRLLSIGNTRYRPFRVNGPYLWHYKFRVAAKYGLFGNRWVNRIPV